MPNITQLTQHRPETHQHDQQSRDAEQHIEQIRALQSQLDNEKRRQRLLVEDIHAELGNHYPNSVILSAPQQHPHSSHHSASQAIISDSDASPELSKLIYAHTHYVNENAALTEKLHSIRRNKSIYLTEIQQTIPQKMHNLHAEFRSLQQEIDTLRKRYVQLQHTVQQQYCHNHSFTVISGQHEPLPLLSPAQSTWEHSPFYQISHQYEALRAILDKAHTTLQRLRQEHTLLSSHISTLEKLLVTAKDDIQKIDQNIVRLNNNLQKYRHTYIQLINNIKLALTDNKITKQLHNTLNEQAIHKIDNQAPVFEAFPEETEETAPSYLAELEILKHTQSKKQTQHDKARALLEQLQTRHHQITADTQHIAIEIDRIQTFKAHQALLNEHPITLTHLARLAPLSTPDKRYQSYTQFQGVPLIPDTLHSLPYLALEYHADDILTHAVLYKNYPLHYPQWGEFNPLSKLITQPHAVKLLTALRSKLDSQCIHFIVKTLLSNSADTLDNHAVDILIWLLSEQLLNTSHAHDISQFISNHHQSRNTPFVRLIKASCRSDVISFHILEKHVREACLKTLDFTKIEDYQSLIQWYTADKQFYCTRLLNDLGHTHYQSWLSLSIEAMQQHIRFDKESPYRQEQLQREQQRLQIFQMHQSLLNTTDIELLSQQLSHLPKLDAPDPIFATITPFPTYPVRTGAQHALSSTALQRNMDDLFICAIYKGYPLNCPQYGACNPIFILYQKENVVHILSQIKEVISNSDVTFLINQLVQTPIRAISITQLEIFKWLLANGKINISHGLIIQNFIAAHHLDTPPLVFEHLVKTFLEDPLGDFSSFNMVIRNNLLHKLDPGAEADRLTLAKWYRTDNTFHIHALFDNLGLNHYIACLRVAEIASKDNNVIFEQPDDTTFESIMNLHMQGRGIDGTSEPLINLITNQPDIFRIWFLGNTISVAHQLSLIRLCPDLFAKKPTPQTPAYVIRKPGVYIQEEDNHDTLLLTFARTSFQHAQTPHAILKLVRILERHTWRQPYAQNLMLKLAKIRILETLNTQNPASDDILEFLDQRRPQSLLIYFIPECLRFSTTSRTIYNGFFSNRSKSESLLDTEKNKIENDLDAFLLSPKL